MRTMRTRCCALVVVAVLAISVSASGQTAENYRVDPLAKGLWRIQAVAGTLSTAYLVEGSNQAVLIDTCTGQEGLKETVEKLIGTKRLVVALTHGHGDHSGGVKYFSEVMVHPDDAAMLPKTATATRRDLKDGDVLDLGGVKLEVVTIPGHTPGSVVFINRAARYAMTGDGIGSSMVWMQISPLPLTTYLQSVKKLEAMKDGIDELYVGHHEQEKVKLTRQYISDMRTVTEKVLDGSAETSPYEMGNRGGRQAKYGSALLVFSPDRLRPQGQAAAARPAPTPRSAEVAPDGRVTFRMNAPNASQVVVNGDWPGGRGLSMAKGPSGTWTLTTDPLTPEIWMYTYSVDGVTTLDPGNSRVVRDGVRRLNALLVPGPASALYQVGKVPHGTVAAVWYPSPVLKTPRRLLVYTPGGYEGGSRKYPVLYLFHGGGGDEEAWNELGSTSAIMDNLIAQGRAKPMIVVMPNANWNDTSILEPAALRAQPAVPAGGQPGTPAAGQAGGAPSAPSAPAQDYSVAEREIVTGMIPFIEANYRALPGRENRAIAGLSMGGGISINVGLKRLDVFATVAQFSTGMFGGVGTGTGGGYGPFDIEKISPGFLADAAATNKKLKLLYFSCGDDDPRMPFQKKVADDFRNAKIVLTFKHYAGAHEWRVWRNSLADVAGMLFQ
jgi:enterochelin esterase-like enzyme/glyoxylase-like metal-dependent hydrolase (beta-lactamase superfamily II)